MFYYSNNLNSRPDEVLTAGTAKLICAANVRRKSIVITSINSNVDYIRVGDKDITTGRGIQLPPGATITLECDGDVYAYAPTTASQTVGVVEILQPNT